VAESAIVISNLRVVRGGAMVLPGLTLAIARGRVTGLLGPSGCGKTTLMRAIVGVQTVAGGDVRVLGMSAGARRLRSRVGYVTQAPAVYVDLTVKENLGYFARILGADLRAVERSIETVGLSGFGEKRVGNLSGGQLARVSLATALLNDPEVLVLDEPTVGLDPVLRRDLWRMFRGLAEAGTTLLVSSHVMDEAERCDDLVLMREGHALATGTPTELLQRTGTATIEGAFLALIDQAEAPR
jgi:ABC-2 type transport system ATP-binding protein